MPQILCRELPEFQWGRGGLATDEVASPLGDFFFCPGLDPRPVDDLPHSDVTLRARPHGPNDPDEAPQDWRDHLAVLAARAKAGLPLTSGYQGSRTVGGFDAD